MFPLDQPLRRRPRQFSSSESITPSSVFSSASLAESTSSSDPSSTASSPSSFSSALSATTSESKSQLSTTRTLTSSTSRSDTLSSATPTSLFTSFTSDSSSEFLTTAPPSSSSPSSTTTSPEPSTPSSGFVLSTFTSSFVSEINGTPTTIVTPIVTSLRTSPPSPGSSRTAVIAGSAVAGIVVLIFALAALFTMRRRVRRQRYWALSRKRLPSRATFLASEEMDLPFPSPPFASADHDDPFATRSIHRINSPGSSSGGGGGDALGMGLYTQSFYAPSQSSHAHAAGSSSSSPPRFLRARASESGSIFQEAVWPPPAQLMDPLTSASQSVDLTRVVTDVMGPQAATPETGPLLPSLGREHGQRREHELERGQEGPERERGPTLRPLSLAIAPPPTNLHDWQQSSSDSQLQIQPSTPSPPLTPPPRPPRLRWLNRSPNHSPRGSPLHQTQPI